MKYRQENIQWSQPEEEFRRSSEVIRTKSNEFYSPYVYCHNDLVNFLDADVKNYNAYNSSTNTNYGSECIGLFDKGGKYYHIDLTIKDTKEGNLIMKYPWQGSTNEDHGIDGKLDIDIRINFADDEHSDKKSNSTKFLNTNDTIIHELQHAVLKAMISTGEIDEIITEHDEMSKAELVKKRLSVVKEVNKTLDKPIPDSELEEFVDNFLDFNYEIYNETKEK